MKIVAINSVKNGSTGMIMKDLAEYAEKNDMEVYTVSAGNYRQRKIRCSVSKKHAYIGNIWENKVHNMLAYHFGKGGTYSVLSTYLFIRKLRKLKPDIIHLHNLHCNYINLKTLFGYIKKSNVRVVWTFHDCWPFTGHCPYFDMEECTKWKTHCYDCPQYQEYPISKVDDSAVMYDIKRECFTGVKDLTIITPSNWLGNLVRQSFLKEYPVKVIHNGIDIEIFKPGESVFKEKYGLTEKIVILGAAFSWNKRKGFDIFIKLSELLDERYQIVLLGIDPETEKRIPSNILGIPFTNDTKAMVDFYRGADIFVNPTRQDNFPTTHLEAMACGTPVITFDSGGAGESILPGCGSCVERENMEELLNAIYQIKKDSKTQEMCRACAERFSLEKSYGEYIKLYQTR